MAQVVRGAPQTIGRFQIKSVLGKGSMGVVFHAHDPQLDRDVAIKLLHLPEGLQPAQVSELTESCLREARISASLNHPGIVQVYDSAVEQGRPYIVLEFIRGTTLSDVLQKEGALDPEYAARIMEQALSAMAYAHKQGVVHLDLKPANIMISENGPARIADFGIARTFGELADSSSGRLIGTPRYMSPEQIQAEGTDPRSDVFSLGIVYYEMLCGRKPFIEEDFDALKQSITNDPHTPLHVHNADIPPAVAEFVDRALKKKPALRFDSATAMHKHFVEELSEDKTRPSGGPADRKEILDFIMQRIKRKGDFPSISKHISTVTSAARSRSSSASQVSSAILQDFSLTSRILRMVNSSYYGNLGGPVTTISRAVVLLGMDTLLDLAAGLSIFEHFLHRSDVDELKQKAIRALFTALNAREIASHMKLKSAEEPFICGMLYHLGQLIVSFYFPDEEQVIQKMMRQNNLSAEVASRKVMRLSYTELGQAIAESWNLPESFQRTISGLRTDHDGPLCGDTQVLQGVTSYAYDLSEATMIADPEARETAMGNLSRKWEGKIDIKPKQLAKFRENAIRNAWSTSNSLRVNLKALGVNPPKGVEVGPSEVLETKPGEAATPGVAGPVDLSAASSPEEQLAPVMDDSIDETLDKPHPDDHEAAAEKRQNFLMKTVGEIAMSLTGDFSLNDVLMMVLEGMYRGLTFQDVLLAMVTPKHDRVICRFGFGPHLEELRTVFDYPLNAEGGFAAACIRAKREIVIPDLRRIDPTEGFAAEFLDLLEPRSVMMAPLVVNDAAIALFCGSRSADQPKISEQDMQNVRTLTNQAVLAIHQSRAKR
ncbi:HDOD domain-containing protein [Candidatus Sumerlaeota bacterium]